MLIKSMLIKKKSVLILQLTFFNREINYRENANILCFSSIRENFWH